MIANRDGGRRQDPGGNQAAVCHRRDGEWGEVAASDEKTGLSRLRTVGRPS